MGLTRKKSRILHAGSNRMQELQDMTVVQLKQLYKDILASPYGLKLQVMATPMSGSVKSDYIRKIIEMETRIQQFTDANEPFEDEETDKWRRRMEKAAEARRQRISNTHRGMYDRMFGRLDAFLRGTHYLK